MSIKISELTPKGANLQNSDLLEISESTADGYSSKSITGAEIITAAQEGLQPTLVSGTNIKTINSTSLLGSGDLEVQPTLVSGTNIKTINGNSLLGSGDLVISGGGGSLTIGTTAITSGTIGRILFEGTGNVVQESANLFWDNTNSRLGIGTASPNMSLDIRTGNVGIGVTSNAGFKLDVNGTTRVNGQISLTNGSALVYPPTASTAQEGLAIYRGASTSIKALTIGITNTDEVVFNTTSADYIFNRSGTEVFNIGGGGTSIIRTRYFGSFQQAIPTGTNINFCFGTSNTSGGQRLQFGFDSNEDSVIGLRNSSLRVRQTVSNFDFININATTGNVVIEKNASALTPIASAKLAINSTTEGFLPPRMTTTQKNAISSPAAGLVVYDTTLNKLCVYTTAWETITSV